MEFVERGAKIDYGLCDQPYGCREFGTQESMGTTSVSARSLLDRPERYVRFGSKADICIAIDHVPIIQKRTPLRAINLVRSVRCFCWSLHAARAGHQSMKTRSRAVRRVETGWAGTCPLSPGQAAPCVALHTWTRLQWSLRVREQRLRCAGSAQLPQNPQPRAFRLLPPAAAAGGRWRARSAGGHSSPQSRAPCGRCMRQRTEHRAPQPG